MNFETFYNESILDYARKTLDPAVFELIDGTPPRIQPAIKQQIFEDLSKLKSLIDVVGVYIIGSILTKYYNKNADIDVTIVVNKEDIDNDTGILDVDAIIQMLRELNGKMAISTTHPINYYITTDLKEENADAIYDLDTDTWVKEPKTSRVEIDDYMDRFEELASFVDISTGKIKRDVIDYNELAELDDDNIIDFHTKISKKLYEVNNKIDELVNLKQRLKQERNDAFARPMTPQEIVKFSSKNKLPSNVVYKLFQKYYYFDLIQKLDDIISDRDKSNEYMGEIEDLLVKTESVSFEEFVDEKFKPVKGASVNWTKPSSTRKYKDKRFNLYKGIRGKSLRQTPSIYSRDREITPRTLNLASKIVNVAKKAPSGIWRITPMQVKEIALKYHHIPPNEHDPIKHLGNTGIAVWRKSKGKFYLVKHRGV